MHFRLHMATNLRTFLPQSVGTWLSGKRFVYPFRPAHSACVRMEHSSHESHCPFPANPQMLYCRILFPHPTSDIEVSGQSHIRPEVSTFGGKRKRHSSLAKTRPSGGAYVHRSIRGGNDFPQGN